MSFFLTCGVPGEARDQSRIGQDLPRRWRRSELLEEPDRRFDGVTLACLVAAAVTFILLAALAAYLALEPLTHPTCDELSRQVRDPYPGANVDPEVVGEFMARCGPNW